MYVSGLKKNPVVRLIALGPSCSEAKWQEKGKDTFGIQYTWRNWKLDRAFVMDDEEWIVTKNITFVNPIDIEKEMRDAKIPVYVAKKWKNVDNTVEFPIEKIKKEFPVHYFMNSMAYMFALAIMEGYERIETYGIDLRYYNDLGEVMKYNRDWIDQTHCGAFWAGVAIGRGIEVVTTERSSLMKPVYPKDPSLYGYEVSSELFKQRKITLDKRERINAKKESERLMVFRPEKGEDLQEFKRKIEMGIAKPIATNVEFKPQ